MAIILLGTAAVVNVLIVVNVVVLIVVFVGVGVGLSDLSQFLFVR